MPRLRLTPQNVATLPAVGPRGEYRDDLERGLVLRVTPKGARSLVVEYTIGRRSKRFLLGHVPPLKLKAARKKARSVLADVALGKDPQAQKVAARQRALTVKDIGERCLNALEVRPATTEEYERLFKVEILPAFGHTSAADISRADVRAWSRRLAKRAPYVANRAFALLLRIYTWALAEDLLAAAPLAGLPKPAQERSSDRVLSAEELRSLLVAFDALPGQYSDAALLLLLTGTRREMVVGMRRAELELDEKEPRWTIPAERMKGGLAHVVPLSGWAVAVLERRLAESSGDAVFPPATVDAKSESMWWSSKYVNRLNAAMLADLRKRKVLGPEDELLRWKVHELRHSVATHLREDLHVGGDVVSALLAHVPPTQGGVSSATKVYLRARLLPERRAALVAWASWLESLKRGARGKLLPHAR